LSRRSLTKIAGSGSGFVPKYYGSATPDSIQLKCVCVCCLPRSPGGSPAWPRGCWSTRCATWSPKKTQSMKELAKEENNRVSWCHLWSAVFRIRIQWFGTRKLDPDSYQGFWWPLTKDSKNLQLKKILILDKKKCFVLFWGLHEELWSYKRSLQLPERTTNTST
jgi:hypothetical protein